MPLVNCPECGGGVSSAAPACPHCGYPHPGRAAVPPPGTPPSRGVRTGWIIFGSVATGALVLGLLGWGAYRMVLRVEQPPRINEELVDFVDTMPPPQPAGPGALPDSVDSVQEPPGESAPVQQDPSGESAAVQQEPPNESAPVLPPGSVTYQLSVLDSPPRLLNADDMTAALARDYPPRLRDAGIAGSVVVKYRINYHGGVDAESVEVMESSHDEFSDVAVRVVKQMRFSPGRYNGSPVSVRVHSTIPFKPSG